MKLMHEDLKSYPNFTANSVPMVVIILCLRRLNRIIQSFPLDCPIKSGHDGNKKLNIFLRSFVLLYSDFSRGEMAVFFGNEVTHKISPSPPLFQRGEEFISQWNRVRHE
jgi:hypothetical protein